MENKILEIAQNFFKKNDIKLSHRLLGGMSNYSYVVLVNEEKYTIRVPGEYAEYFVNRADEKRDIVIFEKLGLTNETIYFDIESGIKISKYIEGTSLNEMSDRFYNEVSILLKKIHNSQIKCQNDYNPFMRLGNYERFLMELGYEIPNAYFEVRNTFLKFKEYLESQTKVLCHNDSQPSNFIKTKEDLKIVDFEFVGQNDPLYDIACFGNMEMKDAIALLQIYYQDLNDDIILRFYLWRAFQCLQWYNVAMFKELRGMSSTLKLDFKAIAFSYLQSASELLKIALNNPLTKVILG